MPWTKALETPYGRLSQAASPAHSFTLRPRRPVGHRQRVAGKIVCALRLSSHKQIRRSIA